MQQYLYNENITFMQWLNASNTALKFLSWMPNNLPVHPSQPVRLWFYNHTKLDTVKLKIKAFFTDGTTSTVTDGMGIASGKGLLEIACGPYELRIPTIDITKTISSYQIWLENSDGTIKTETKTFVIDYTTYERNDILFFRTSLGVNEVLWCHGRRSETITTTSTERTQPLGNHIYEGGTIRTYRANLTYPFKMNTGWFHI